jgi:hypothetical protein
MPPIRAEEGNPPVTPSPQAAVLPISQGEDFARSDKRSLEESAVYTPTPVALALILAPPSEDFAHLHPDEESTLSQSVPTAPAPLLCAPSSEELARAEKLHPDEESTLPQPGLYAAPVTPRCYSDEEFEAVPVGEETAFVPTLIAAPTFTISYSEDFTALRKPTAALEEYGASPASFAVVAALVPAADEEFGLPHVEEEASTTAVIAPALLPTMASIGEAIVFPRKAIMPDEYGATATPQSTSSWITWISLDEEFSGVVVEEETSAWITPTTPSTWFSAPVDEEFGLSHPVEEESTTLVILAVIPPISANVDELIELVIKRIMPDEYGVSVAAQATSTSVTFAQDEEFAGALVEEDSTATAFWLPQLSSVSISATDEEFAAAHPTEETSSALFMLSVLPPSVFPALEDFAGALPVEEEAAAFWIAPIPFVTLAPPAEDFAGSQVDEAGTWTWTATPVWFGLPVVDEEFALSHPTEESTPPFIVTFNVAPQASTSEDFAGALPIEEIAPWWPISTSLWISGFSADEEFGLSHPAEEETSLLFVLPVATFAALSPLEDFAGALPLEEASETARFGFVPNPFVLPPDPPEDFAGSAPLEETMQTWQPPAPTWLSVVVADEEYGLSHPSEESSPLPFIVVFNAASLPPLPEEFAGSLPAEETSPWQWVAKLPPIASATVNEEFGLPHPIEENYAATLIFVPPLPIAVVSLDENFAGSLPLEEPSSTLTPLAATAYAYAATPEDFTGSLPLEETTTAATWWPSSSLTFVSQQEEFGGAHPFEEAAAQALVFVDVVSPATLSFEDFAGSLPIDGDHGADFPVFQPPFLTSTFPSDPEEVVVALPLEEEAALVWILPSSTLLQPSVEEAYARSIVDEWSNPQLLFYVPPVDPFGDETGLEDIRPPPIPPRPRPPKPPRPFRIPPSRGGNVAPLYFPPKEPACPPDAPLVDSTKDNYALLPLEGEAIVRALADGCIEIFEDPKAGLITKLTADDGAVYFYAKVRGARPGRVKKDDVIGVTVATQHAPSALPESSAAFKQLPPKFGVVKLVGTSAPLPPLSSQPQRLVSTSKVFVVFGLFSILFAGALYLTLPKPKPTPRLPPPAPKKRKARRKRRR